MSRELPIWTAKRDDEAIPPRVQLRVFQKTNGCCASCTRKLVPGKWACDHIVALVNGGKHAEDNLQALCVSPCHSAKTRVDVAIKSKNYQVAVKAAGIDRKPSRLQGQGFRKASPQRSASRPLELRR